MTECMTYRPSMINFQQLVRWKDKAVKPIECVIIPHITVPSHLASKKRSTESNNSIAIDIRQLFTSVIDSNVDKIVEQLRAIVYAKAQNIPILTEVAEEMLQNFIIHEQRNVRLYMPLLNAIHNASILISDSDQAKKI